MNKNTKILLLVITSVVVVMGIIVFLTTKVFKKEYDITNIVYSYGGGYGTEITSATKTISISCDGTVTFTNSYDNSIYDYRISNDKYIELYDYINDRMHLFKERVHEENNLADGTTSHIELTLSDGTKYKFGGYMVTNKKYKDIKDKIFEIIDSDKLNEYINNVGKVVEPDTVFHENNGNIIYSYGGGYGTIEQTATRYIHFYSDGRVVLKNDYNSNTNEYNIDVSKYDELYNYIAARMDLFDEIPANSNTLDGSNQSITVTFNNGITKVYSGYMVIETSKTFAEIKDKVYEIADSDKIEQYSNSIK